MNEKLLSVIISTFNSEEFLKDCLESICQSTYKNIEVVIVDDGSTNIGASEKINQIVSDFSKQHTLVIKTIKNKKNEGLYWSRIVGSQQASGDYLAFLDADDTVSCDYYRSLLFDAERMDADIVRGNFLIKNESAKFFRFPRTHFNISKVNLYGNEILDLLINQKGMDWSLHTVWGGIYRADLWQRALPYLKKYHKHILMCEDVLFSVILYSLGKHLIFASDPSNYYYYSKHFASSTSAQSADYKKVSKTLADICLVFECLKNHFKLTDRTDHISALNDWLVSYCNQWLYHAKELKFSPADIDKLYELVNSHFSQRATENGDYFTSRMEEVTDFTAEEIKKIIASKNITVLSFDIFDTLVVRPFLTPTDLFNLLSEYANEIIGLKDIVKFKDLRIDAESQVRKISSREEISIDEIYEFMSLSGTYTIEQLNKIKNYEKELEIRYCSCRQFVKSLYELACYLQKRVIAISDMYLDKETLTKILEKSGFNQLEDIFVSSEYRQTKWSGKLFRSAIKNMRCKPAEVLHLGDNPYSDVEIPKKLGMKSYWIPKTTDLIFSDRLATHNTQNVFRKAFTQSYLHRENYPFLIDREPGLSAMLGVVCNKLFDYPFVSYPNDSDFDGNPYIAGYYALGMHLFAASHWLTRKVEENSYDSINFVARDGWLMRESFSKFAKTFNINIDINYVHLNRSTVIPLQVSRKEDLATLPTNLFFNHQTPKTVLKLFKNWLRDNIDADSISTGIYCKDKGFDYQKVFESYSDFLKFCTTVVPDLLSWDKLSKFRNEFSPVLEKCFKGHSAMFDIGYSCRVETALKNTINCDITSYYICTFPDISHLRTLDKDLSYHSFYHYNIGNKGQMREIMFSSLEPSAKTLVIKNGDAVVNFSVQKLNYESMTVLSSLHSGALDFVHDMLEIFGREFEKLAYLKEDASLIYEYWLQHPQNKELEMFNRIVIEDALGGDCNEKNLASFWKTQSECSRFHEIKEIIHTIDNTRVIKEEIATPINYSGIKPRWLRCLYLFYMDRGALKWIVSQRLRGHPIILSNMKRVYRTAKSIRHFFG